MNNNKDFSEQLGDLFDELSLDQAGNLIDNEIEPSKKELQEEVIENIRKNDIKIDRNVLSELKEKLGTEDGEAAVMDYLRESYGLKLTEEVKDLVEIVGPEDNIVEEEAPEEPVYQKTYVNDLSDRLAKVLAQKGMRDSKDLTEERASLIEQRVEAIHQQLNLLRGSVMESTLVSGIGQGGDGQTPGSGEVLLHRLDDVDIPYKTGTTGLHRGAKPDIQDGDILVWSEAANNGHGGWTVTSGGSLNPDTVTILGKSFSCQYFGADAPLFLADYDTFLADNHSDPLVDVPGRVTLYTECQSFDYVVGKDVQLIEDPSDPGFGLFYGDWYVVGAKNVKGDALPNAHFEGYSHPQKTDAPCLGVYFRQGIDGVCGAPGPGDDIEDLVIGSITGCSEINQPGGLWWGTTEDYVNLNEGDPHSAVILERPDGTQITDAIGVVSVVGIIPDGSLDPIRWDVVYLDGSRKPHTAHVDYDPDDVVEPTKGAFVYSSDPNVICISGSDNSGPGLTDVSTREVTLAKVDDITRYDLNKSILGQLPITDVTDFETQEDFNVLIFDIATELHKLKPTILVCEFNKTPGLPDAGPDYDLLPIADESYKDYIPIKGDLWLDPGTQILRGCTEVKLLPPTDPLDRLPEFEATWVIISGNSTGSDGEVIDKPTTSKDVTLINTLELYHFYDSFTQAGGGSHVTWEDFEDMFGLITQENLNIFNFDLLKQLNKSKPTVTVTDDIFAEEVTFTQTVQNPEWDERYQDPSGDPVLDKDGNPILDDDGNPISDWEAPPKFIEKEVKAFYVPRKGDIWIDSRDYTMYVADYGPEGGDGLPPQPSKLDNLMYPYQDETGRFIFWVEVGSAGAGGSKVYIQMDPPENTIQGDLWIEESTYFTYVYANGTWVALTGDQSAIGKTFRIHVADLPPSDPDVGDCWFSLEDTELRIWIVNTSTNTIDAGIDPGWYPVSSGGIGVNVFEEQDTMSSINYEIQLLNARLAALEQKEEDETPIAGNYSYPLDGDQMSLIISETNHLIERAAVDQGTYEEPSGESEPISGAPNNIDSEEPDSK